MFSVNLDLLLKNSGATLVPIKGEEGQTLRGLVSSTTGKGRTQVESVVFQNASLKDDSHGRVITGQFGREGMTLKLEFCFVF